MSFGMVAEKNSVCRLIGSLATILRMSLMKPMSSMRSASSSTRNSTWLSFKPLLCTRSSRRPGVATSTSTPLHDRADLASHRHAADRERRGQADVAAIGVEAVEDLPGQFAGRGEHQHAAGLRLRPDAVLEQAMEDRQREGGGLAGAGLGDADDVAAGQRERDGLGLDGGGGEVVLFLKGTRDGIGEAEVLKGGQKVGSFFKTAGARLMAAGARRRLKEHPRVWGVGCWVKGQARSRQKGLRTRGSQ